MCGGPDIEAPKPTQEEIALQREQLDILREQRALQEALMPYYLEQAGLVPVSGGKEVWVNTRTGQVMSDQEVQAWKALLGGKTPAFVQKKRISGGMKFRPMTEEERLARMTPEERMAYENYKLMLERQRKALEGKLPVSPALEAEIEKQRKELEENLSARLGPNWRLTTPGQQALNQFQKRAELLREEAREGQLSGATGLLVTQAGYLSKIPEQKTTQYTKPINIYGGLLSEYSRAEEPYRQQRMLEYKADVENSLISSQQTAGLLGGLFTLGGVGLGGWLYGRGGKESSSFYNPAGLFYRE